MELCISHSPKPINFFFREFSLFQFQSLQTNSSPSFSLVYLLQYIFEFPSCFPHSFQYIFSNLSLVLIPSFYIAIFLVSYNSVNRIFPPPFSSLPHLSSSLPTLLPNSSLHYYPSYRWFHLISAIFFLALLKIYSTPSL